MASNRIVGSQKELFGLFSFFLRLWWLVYSHEYTCSTCRRDYPSVWRFLLLKGSNVVFIDILQTFFRVQNSPFSSLTFLLTYCPVLFQKVRGMCTFRNVWVIKRKNISRYTELLVWVVMTYRHSFRGSFTWVTSDKQTARPTNSHHYVLCLDGNIYLLNSLSFSSMNIIHQ